MSSKGPTAIGSYTAAEVARLAGVSAHRVGRWAREGIILPSISQHPNVYSYADAGEAIVAHYLVEQGKAPREIKEAVHSLREQYGDWPLATAQLAHDGALLLEWDADDGCWRSVDIPEHEVMEATLIDLTGISKSLARGGWVAIETPRAHIEVDPDMHSGTPVVKGRRLPTTLVAGIASRDGGRATLRDDYGVSDAEIDDAVDYEADLAKLAAA
ncbi:MAG TPA: DUF433 domain-containing protein [Solirubrobacteraceae bacterium]|nr:DUF433 domain-containing protein [Solirubrobacteraceae bacterium]